MKARYPNEILNHRDRLSLAHGAEKAVHDFTAAANALVEKRNAKILAALKPDSLATKLSRIAKLHYIQLPDGTYQVKHDEPISWHDSFASAYEESARPENIKNIDHCKTYTGIRDDKNILEKIDSYAKGLNYTGVSFLNSGAEAMMFRMKQRDAVHVARIEHATNRRSAGVEPVFGIGPTLDPIHPYYGGLPDKWKVFVFPEIVPLDKISGIKRKLTLAGTLMVPGFREKGRDPYLTGDMHILGDEDYIVRMLLNGLPEGYANVDGILDNLGLLPNGAPVIYDCSVIATADKASPERIKDIEQNKIKYGHLGCPFIYKAEDSTSLQEKFFQPARFMNPEIALRVHLLLAIQSAALAAG